jgi:hypothetical protein
MSAVPQLDLGPREGVRRMADHRMRRDSRLDRHGGPPTARAGSPESGRQQVRGGILSAWDPATQRERWFALGGGQSGGGTLSLASNVVIQTMINGRLRAFTADKSELLLDMALPLISGRPAHDLHARRQTVHRRDGRNRGRPAWTRRRARGSAGADSRCRSSRNDAGRTPPAAPAPPNTNPKMFVYSVLN